MHGPGNAPGFLHFRPKGKNLGLQLRSELSALRGVAFEDLGEVGSLYVPGGGTEPVLSIFQHFSQIVEDVYRFINRRVHRSNLSIEGGVGRPFLLVTVTSDLEARWTTFTHPSCRHSVRNNPPQSENRQIRITRQVKIPFTRRETWESTLSDADRQRRVTASTSAGSGRCRSRPTSRPSSRSSE